MNNYQEENDFYNRCFSELIQIIPEEERTKILSQEYCELAHDFLGFVNVYKPLSEMVPKNKIIIDFGCYLAAQAYFFKDHRAYIGVDTTELLRFAPKNTKHYITTIQDFINNQAKELLLKYDNLDFFAICSYVPDFEATELVRKTFKNVCCYYPKE